MPGKGDLGGPQGILHEHRNCHRPHAAGHGRDRPGNFLGGRKINVADQTDDPASLLTFCRRLLRLRRATPALIGGDYHALHPQSEAYLAFLRHEAASGQTCLVALNFSAEAQTVIFDLPATQPRMLFSSQARDDQALALDWLTLAPFEIFIAALT